MAAKDQSMVGMEPEANTVSVGQAIHQASIEVSLFGAPVMIIALAGAVGWQPMVFWLVLCEWIGLSLGLGWSRATGGKTIVKWPQPSSTVERATTGIAYNGVLGLGIIISIIAWLATRWFFVGAVIAIVAPVWLLKHLQIILTLSEPEVG